MKLSIIVPACNEEARIGRMLDAYLPYFSDRYGSDVEFLVVINGSTDRTEEVVKGYTDQYSNLKYIVEPKRVGKGGALMLGFSKARGTLVGFTDADGSTPPEAFQDLIDNIGDAGIIIASRWRSGAKVTPKQPLLRRIASRAFNLMTRLMFGLRLTDTQCGAKLMRREAVMQVLPDLGLTRWAFDVDLLSRLKRAGHKITEIPTTWHNVKGSKLDVFQVSIEMFAAVTRLRLLFSPFKWIVSVYDRTLGPFMHPPGLEQDHLLRHSLLLMTGVQLANMFNLLFQVAMNWMLKPAHYGDMAVMLNISMIVGISVGALRWTLTHFSARFIQDGNSEKIKPMVVSVVRDLSLVGVPLFVVWTAACRPLADFFQLETPVAVIVTGISLLAALYVPVLGGALNGCQAFVRMSNITISCSFVRFAVGVGCVLVGFATVGALSAHALGALLCIMLCVRGLARILGPGFAGCERVRGIYTYFLRYGIALLGYSIMMNADVILVKHYFPSVEAGLFAKAAMVARIVVFFPLPVAAVMFPKVASSGGRSYGSWRTYLKALALVVFLVVAISLTVTIFPRFILLALTGSRLPDLVPIVRGMVWALSPLSIVFIIMNFELAQRRFAITIPLVLCGVGYIVGVAVWHDTLLQVALVLAVVSIISLIASAVCSLIQGSHWGRKDQTE